MTDDNSKETSSTETHAVEYVGNARVWRHSASGRTATPDAPRIRGLSKDEADRLVRNHEFEHADESDIADVLAGNLDELESALESGAFDGRLDALFNHEQANKDREGAYEMIQDRGDSLTE